MSTAKYILTIENNDILEIQNALFECNVYTKLKNKILIEISDETENFKFTSEYFNRKDINYMNSQINIDNIGNREKQVIGALALYKFCKTYLIYDESVNQLLNHLIDILISENLDEWNNNGLQIEIIGRGEPLPNKIDSKINFDLKEDFYRLVDIVIEIGIVDLYGSDTMYPNLFLKQVFDILIKNKIEFPIPDILIKHVQDNKWGKVWDINSFKKFKLEMDNM